MKSSRNLIKASSVLTGQEHWQINDLPINDGNIPNQPELVDLSMSPNPPSFTQSETEIFVNNQSNNSPDMVLNPGIAPKNNGRSIRNVLHADCNLTSVTQWQIDPLSYLPGSLSSTSNFDANNGKSGELIREATAKSEVIIQKATEKADVITSQARIQAEALVIQANKQTELIRSQAYEEGMLKAIAEAKELMESINLIFIEGQEWRTKIMNEFEPEIIEILKLVSKKIFGDGFQLDHKMIEAIVTRAIGEANRLGDLRVFLNPKDASKLASLWQEAELYLNGQKIELVSSQDIRPGGCFIEGEFGSVDGRVETQIDQIVKAFTTTFINREEKFQE